MENDFPPGLYLVATPIGNMGDLTLRAADILRKADAVACEDTRETGKLCARHGLAPLKIPYHEHNAAKMRPRIISMIRAGQRVALVSDAGTPLISDPGYKLVRACVEEGLHVTAAPGPCAALAALTLSGLPTDRFFFAGFLPPKSGARKAALKDIAAVPGTLVFYETAPRLAGSLADMQAVLGDRPAAVARELTKKFEEMRRGLLSDLAAVYAAGQPPRGEIAVVVGAAEEGRSADIGDIDDALRAALKTMTLRDAAAFVAQQAGRKKKDVYARALALQGG